MKLPLVHDFRRWLAVWMMLTICLNGMPNSSTSATAELDDMQATTVAAPQGGNGNDCAGLLSRLAVTTEQWAGRDGMGEVVIHQECRTNTATDGRIALGHVFAPWGIETGWQESAHIAAVGMGTTRLGVFRYATEADAEHTLEMFDALYRGDLFAGGSTMVQVAEAKDLPGNQRGLFTGGWGSWGSLITQEGPLVFLYSQNSCCWSDNPRPAFPDISLSWAYLNGRWDGITSDAPKSATFASPSEAQAAETALGKRCQQWGELECAREAYEAAYTLNPSVEVQSELAEFYVLLGDALQESERLQAAKRAYSQAASLASQRDDNVDLHAELDSYATVELFDPFTDFASLRGCDPHNALILEGSVCRQSGFTERRLEAVADSPATLLWDPESISVDYAVAANIVAIAPTSVIGLILGNFSGSDGFAFMVDPLRGVWWVDQRSPDGTAEAMFAPQPLPIDAGDPIRRVEVRMTAGTPILVVNELFAPRNELLEGLPVRPDGNFGVIVERSYAAANGPVSATFDSFGLYGLNGGVGREPRLSDSLPSPRLIGHSWRLSDEGWRSKEEIAFTFPDPLDASRRFAELGWLANAYRDYVDSESETTLTVSLHEFGSFEAAIEAADYLADARAVALGLSEVDDGEGWILRSLGGEVAGKHELSMYLLDGPTVVRITVASELEDQLQVAGRVAWMMADAAGVWG